MSSNVQGNVYVCFKIKAIGTEQPSTNINKKTSVQVTISLIGKASQKVSNSINRLTQSCFTFVFAHNTPNTNLQSEFVFEKDTFATHFLKKICWALIYFRAVAE